MSGTVSDPLVRAVVLQLNYAGWVPTVNIFITLRIIPHPHFLVAMTKV